VVFTYGGDLWTASTSAGWHASDVASGAGTVCEVFSRRKWIAFTGQYDGDEQVYVIPSTGGIPKQLTFYPARGPLTPRWGYDNQVYGWFARREIRAVSFVAGNILILATAAFTP